MLTVLDGLAEFECELIKSRIGEGRARAKARGVKPGRKPKLTPPPINATRPSAAATWARKPLQRLAAAITSVAGRLRDWT